MGGYQNRNQYEWVPRFMGIVYFVFPKETRNNLRAPKLSVEKVFHPDHEPLPGTLYRTQLIFGLIAIDPSYFSKSSRHFEQSRVQRPFREFHDSQAVSRSCLSLCSVGKRERLLSRPFP